MACSDFVIAPPTQLKLDLYSINETGDTQQSLTDFSVTPIFCHNSRLPPAEMGDRAGRRVPSIPMYNSEHTREAETHKLSHRAAVSYPRWELG